MRAAMNAHPEGIVACNNDLLAANMIDDGERLCERALGGNDIAGRRARARDERGAGEDAEEGTKRSQPNEVATGRHLSACADDRTTA
mgnify:CR=1 FL=1